MENWSRPAECKGNGCVPHCRLVQVQELIVPANDFVVPRKPVCTRSKIPWVAILSTYSRASTVQLESLRHHHCRGLGLKTVREDKRQPGGTWPRKLIKPTKEIFSIQRKPLIFQAAIESRHPVSEFID